jgi:hypothetical protein
MNPRDWMTDEEYAKYMERVKRSHILAERDTKRRSTKGRFDLRIEDHKSAGVHVLTHHFHWVLHNLVIHPIIAVCPFTWAFKLHDWSSSKLNRYDLK